MAEPPVSNQILEKEESQEQIVSSEKKAAPKVSSEVPGLESLDLEAGLADLEGASARVDVSEKKMINSRADVNQLVPFKSIGLGRNILMEVLITGCHKK